MRRPQKGSAAGFVAKRPDHLHPEGRRWPPKGQQQVFQQRDQITYTLRAGNGHQRSASGLAAKRPDYLLPEGRRLPSKGQEQVLWQRDQITYSLRAGYGHQRVSGRFFSKETRSLTYCEQVMATKGSAAGFAEKRPDHVLPEGRTWPPKGQGQVLQQKDQNTYPLRAGYGHQRVSGKFCSKETRSFTS